MIIFPSFRGCLGSTVTTAWSPQDLGPIVWLDASDTSTVATEPGGSTVPLTSGGQVGEWRNKATGYTAYKFVQGYPGLRPLYKLGGVNSLPCMEFNLAKDHNLEYGVANDVARNVAGLTVFAAIKQIADSTSSNGATMFFAATNSGTANRVLFEFGRNAPNSFELFARKNDGEAFSTVPSATALGTTNWHTVGGDAIYPNPKLTANKASLYLNSSTANTSATMANFTDDATNSTGNTSAKLGVGSGANPTGAFFMGELIVIIRKITDAERLSLVNYLNAKWRTTL